jgi:hypothetical protein
VAGFEPAFRPSVAAFGTLAIGWTTAGSSTNTFNVGVNTTSTGAGEFRQVTQQPIAINARSKPVTKRSLS